jgi:glucan 1,3-beta-glucosidase
MPLSLRAFRPLILTLLQSTDNVRVPCTNNGVENCGLMQSFNSHTRFNPADVQGSITQMVRDGTQGTPAGPGLVQIFNDPRSGGNPYNVFRIYNSGNIAANEDLSNANGATASYVSDVANRLLGWDGSGPGAASCGF